MTNQADFLADQMPRPWAPEARQGFQPIGLFVGKGANAIEVVVARSSQAPTRTALLESWKARRAGRAAPVLLVVLHPGGAGLCGASGEQPPVYPSVDEGQVERLCQEVLDQADRHVALRFLAQALPSLETALPGSTTRASLPCTNCSTASRTARTGRTLGARLRRLAAGGTATCSPHSASGSRSWTT